MSPENPADHSAVAFRMAIAGVDFSTRKPLVPFRAVIRSDMLPLRPIAQIDFTPVAGALTSATCDDGKIMVTGNGFQFFIDPKDL